MLSYVFWNQVSEIKHWILCAASLNQTVYTGSQTGEICYWENGQPYMLCTVSSESSCLFVCTVSSPNSVLLGCNHLLVTLHADLRLRTWDAEDGRCLNSQKLSQKITPLGLSSSNKRLIIVWTDSSYIVIDSWTLNQLSSITLTGKIISIKIISNSKILALTSKGELKFWNYENTSIQENPYFEVKLNKLYKDFYPIPSFDLIIFLHENRIEIRKMSDLKFDNHAILELYTPSALMCGNFEKYFYVVFKNKVLRFLCEEILEEVNDYKYIGIHKNLSILGEECSSDCNDCSCIADKNLISFDCDSIVVQDLLSFPKGPDYHSFSIEKSNIIDTPEDIITHSSVVIRPWPLVLIGTSQGKVILKSLNSNEKSVSHSFHTTPITCVDVCKDCIVSCSDDSILCIYHPDQKKYYCQLMSPVYKFKEVSCIEDTTHNANDNFWKNSWKNWDQTILIHCEDSSIVLVSLVTNSVISTFNTRIPHVSEAKVHVMLDYLLIRSHEAVYVFNITIQAFERILYGSAANEVMRKQISLHSDLTSNSSTDLECEEHRLIEINWRNFLTFEKGIRSNCLKLQGIQNPIITVNQEINPEYTNFVLSLLTCWKSSCKSHQTLAKNFKDLKSLPFKLKPGIKGKTWQSFFISGPANNNKNQSKSIESLMSMYLIKITSLACTELNPSFGHLAVKSINGNIIALNVMRDLVSALDSKCKSEIISKCKEILKLRNPTSAVIKTTKSIIGKIPGIEIETEWRRQKNTPAENLSAIMLAYLSRDADNHTILMSITSLFSMLRSGNSNLICVASKTIAHTFPIWKSLISQKIKEIIKELVVLSVNSPLSAAYNKTIGVIVSSEIKTYMTLLSEEITAVDANERNAWLKSFKWITTNKYDQLVFYLPLVLDIILKILNPNNPIVRKSCLDQTSEILQILVLMLPMVCFSQTKQRIAVGTMENTIMVYDLKTASYWKCLEGHEAPVSAITFSKGGESLVSYSAQDTTIRVWRIEHSFFQGLVGIKNVKPSSVIPLSQIKKSVCNFKEFIDCISIQLKNDCLKLVREDSRTYAFSLVL